MNGYFLVRTPESASSISPSSVTARLPVSRWCGRLREAATTPRSSMIWMVEEWMVSPRKSCRKSRCFSSTRTGTPDRASSQPSIAPAGPPPAMTHVVSCDIAPPYGDTDEYSGDAGRAAAGEGDPRADVLCDPPDDRSGQRG